MLHYLKRKFSPEAPAVETPKTEPELPGTIQETKEEEVVTPNTPEKETVTDTETADKFFDSLGEEDRKVLEKYKGKPYARILKA